MEEEDQKGGEERQDKTDTTHTHTHTHTEKGSGGPKGNCREDLGFAEFGVVWNPVSWAQLRTIPVLSNQCKCGGQGYGNFFCVT